MSWLAPDPGKLPDFIIGGAAKCGTSTLHKILNSHPGIFIPDGEIGFFDLDNVLQHSNTNFFDKRQKVWIAQRMDDDPPKVWAWYAARFAGAENVVKGEDSTTYLASRSAADRIARQEKRIKLIFLLRNPTHRTRSAYYHNLRSGAAIFGLEDTIRFQPHSLLDRGMYTPQLRYWYERLPREDIKVLLFEDLISKTREVVREVCDFIGVDFSAVPENAFDTHSNKARIPRSIRLQLWRNRLLQNLENRNFSRGLPYEFEGHDDQIPLLFRGLERIHLYVNPLRVGKAPPMEPATAAFLDDFFARELAGLDELVGREVIGRWFGRRSVGHSRNSGNGSA